MSPQKETEQPTKKSRLIGWAATLLAGTLITAGVAYYRSVSGEAPFPAFPVCLSDGAFTAAVLIGGLGLLVWIASTGFFDIYAYGFRSMVHHLLPFTGLKSPGKYYEFKTERDAKRRKSTLPLLPVGLIFLAIAAIAYLIA